MSRDRRLAILLVIGLILIASAWLLPRLEWVEVDVPARPSGEALRDDALAARRMIAALGYRTRVIQDATELARLPQHATLWLNQALPDAAAGRTSEQIAAWVNAGGHAVIAVPGSWQPQRLSKAFGIQALGMHVAKSGARLDIEGRPMLVGIRQCDVFTTSHPVMWQASVKGYKPRHGDDEDDEPDESNAHAKAPAGKALDTAEAIAVARFRVGKGALTVLCDDRPMLNPNIGQQDNARFAAAVLLEGDRDEVIFATQPEYPALPLWLWQRAPLLILSLGTLVMLLLWRAGIRFGALQAVPPASRPGLQLHLRALAAFLLRQRQYEALLRGPRDEVRRLLAKLPGNAAEQITDAAKRAALTPEAITEALETTPRDAHHYLRQATTLAQLDTRLRAARPGSARRKTR